MCGVAGIGSSAIKPHHLQYLKNATHVLHHRGPDHHDVWSDDQVALGHTRLSIIDLSDSANQPMHDELRNVHLVYNGEIYNFKHLRSELQSAGRIFRTDSDTEVVLQAYLHWGTDAFAKLEGMFAVAVWDATEHCLHLARDGLGIKPLYYVLEGSSIFFASEIKAIHALMPSRTWRISKKGFHEFLWFGNALGQNCLLDGILKVEAGWRLTWRPHGKIEKECFWAPVVDLEREISFEEAKCGVKARLRTAVDSHLVSDVPIGLFLSGGIDSSAILAMAAARLGSALKTYSVGFDFAKTSELPVARALAQKFGTTHHELTVRAGDIAELIPRLIQVHDEPFSDSANIPLYLLTKELGGQPKVVLQGDGGDEVFAGYARYRWLRWKAPWPILSFLTQAFIPGTSDPPDVIRRLLRVIEALGGPTDDRFPLLLSVETKRRHPLKAISACYRRALTEYNPFERYIRVAEETREADLVQRLLLTDLRVLLPDTFLEKVDRSTMANSTEVRVPFLDKQLVEFALSLPSSYKVGHFQGKRVLKAALRDIVPDDVLDRPKQGFGVPFSRWLKEDLANFARDNLLGGRATKDGLLDRDYISSLLDDHIADRRESGFLLWKLLNFSIWYEMSGVQP